MRPGMPTPTVLPPATTTMTPPTPMVMPTTMRMRSPSRLVLLTMPEMQEERQDRRPHEEEHLHDANRKRRLQHRACLLEVLGERVPGLFAREAEGTQGLIDCVGAAGPVTAVCGADETQLVDRGNEGTEEAEVDEDDEDRRAFGRVQPDEGVQTPEDGHHGDDE